MFCSIVNDFSSQSHDLTIMLTSLGITYMGQETYVASQERDLLEALKATMQQPLFGPF
jgi:heat shock protein HslJ